MLCAHLLVMNFMLQIGMVDSSACFRPDENMCKPYFHCALPWQGYDYGLCRFLTPTFTRAWRREVHAHHLCPTPQDCLRTRRPIQITSVRVAISPSEPSYAWPSLTSTWSLRTSGFLYETRPLRYGSVKHNLLTFDFLLHYKHSLAVGQCSWFVLSFAFCFVSAPPRSS